MEEILSTEELYVRQLGDITEVCNISELWTWVWSSGNVVGSKCQLTDCSAADSSDIVRECLKDMSFPQSVQISRVGKYDETVKICMYTWWSLPLVWCFVSMATVQPCAEAILFSDMLGFGGFVICFCLDPKDIFVCCLFLLSRKRSIWWRNIPFATSCVSTHDNHMQWKGHVNDHVRTLNGFSSPVGVHVKLAICFQLFSLWVIFAHSLPKAAMMIIAPLELSAPNVMLVLS